jgi:iron complex transport system substrate-binding protein
MKIVTLLPSATEIVCALGLRESLVAVSHECDYPASVACLPRITSSILPEHLSPKGIDDAVVQAVRSGQALYQVNGGLLAALQPDLIITQGVCDVCAVNLGTVQETLLFLPDVIAEEVHVLSLSGKNFAGILRDIQQAGAAAHSEDAAIALIQTLRHRWDLIRENQSTRKPKILVLEWPEPFFYGGHWVPEMVDVAGGIDVIGQEGMDSGRCTLEQMQELDPDIIVLAACGYGLEQNIQFAQTLFDKPETRTLRAAQFNQIWACDANSFFSRPAPRVVEGTEILQAIFQQKESLPAGVARVVPNE